MVQILKAELAKRCQRNPRYSLRSFARALGISPANLSLILNSKRAASEKTIDRILERINLKPIERNGLRTPANQELPREGIDSEVAEQICSWLCYAILSLVETKNFQPSPSWISKRLAVSVHEVRQSLAVLVRSGQLIINEKHWRTTGEIRVKNRATSATIRNFHRELMEKAQNSMDFDPFEFRDISSITFAMSPEMMADAKDEIRKFRLRMSEIFEEKGQSTEVYNLTVQLTPATSIEKRGNNGKDPVITNGRTGGVQPSTQWKR